MVWTTVCSASYVAEQYNVNPYILVEGAERDVLGYINKEFVPTDHDAVYVREHETYRDALAFCFEQPRETMAIGVADTVIDVDPTKLTVVTESEWGGE